MGEIVHAAVLAVGDELLNGGVSDTNTARIALALEPLGVELLFSLTVRDRVEEISQGISHALSKVPLLFVCGGIGPTSDDVTREAVAQALNLPLELSQEAWESIEKRLKERSIPVRDGHKKQAMIPRGAIPLPNSAGSAWGALVEMEGRVLVLLPGVPKELSPMLERALELLPPHLRGGERIMVCLRSFGLPESEIDQKLQPIWERGRVALGLRVISPRHTEVRLSGSPKAVEEALGVAISLLGEAVYSTKGESLEEVLGRLLVEQEKTIATAESCTGGMISHTVTNVPGSSRYMIQALVTYSNEAKEQLLGVSRQTLVDHGAVSPQTAEEMVRGLRRVSGADCCAAVTGIAGPGGGTPEKPVGLVYAGFFVDERCWVREYRFSGTRMEIKTLTTMSVLNELRLELKGRGGEVLSKG